MSAKLVLGLLVLMVAVVAAQKKKTDETAELPPPPSDDGEAAPPPPVMDGKTPYTGDRGTPRHHKKHPPPGGVGPGKEHRKNPHHGKRPGKAFQDSGAIKAEIMHIKNADIPEEEKAARLKALRDHVRSGGMIENMPEEARQRQHQLRTTVQEIMNNDELTQEEKREQVEEAKRSFRSDMQALRGALPPEQIARMREERKKTIEGHTAAAMAAKLAGHTEMARKYSRKAREAAQGNGRPNKARAKKASLSEPDF